MEQNKIESKFFKATMKEMIKGSKEAQNIMEMGIYSHGMIEGLINDIQDQEKLENGGLMV